MFPWIVPGILMDSSSNVRAYDPCALPLRSEEEMLRRGEEVILDEGDEEYQLDSKVGDAIDAVTAASRSIIPSAFGARPPNFMTQKSACSAET
jgi:hypothetical protein